MPTNAEKIMAKKMETNTNCDPKTGLPYERTNLNTGMPPVGVGAPTGRRARIEQTPYTDGNMNSGGRGKNVAIGALVLGGLAAGAYALYKNQSSGGRNTSVGNSIAGWLPNGEPVTIRKRRTICARPAAVYAEWRNLENLPNILSHLEEVKVLDDGRSYWEAKGPAGTSASWYATVTEDEPGRALSWQAEENSEVPNSGRILFSEKPNGDTLMEVRLTYQPPAGDLGRAIASAFGEDPAQQIEDDLTNFKFAMEERVESNA